MCDVSGVLRRDDRRRRGDASRGEDGVDVDN